MNPRQLEDQDRVKAFDEALKKDPEAALAAARQARQHWAEQGVTVLDWSGWPLRPLFIPRTTLDFICEGMHRQLVKIRDLLVEGRGDLDNLTQKVPLHPDMFHQLITREGLEAENLLQLYRPDGFLYEDHWVWSEINLGNGTQVSNTYQEVLYDLFGRSPILKELGWDVDQGIGRPFQRYVDLVADYVPAKESPLVALMIHSHEWQTILDWPERIVQQVELAQRRFQERGWRIELVHEDGLKVDPEHNCRLAEDDQLVDCVCMWSIGTSFMDEPERVRDEWPHLRGATVGKAPLVQPLAGLAFDKGLLPWMGTALEWPVVDPATGFQVRLPQTDYPDPERAAEYRTEREKWVLKRSFDGKDTVVGTSAPGRLWNRILGKAMNSFDYVIQEYATLPETEVPISVDGERIDWVPVQVEISPFVVRGKYVGGFARYAPSGRGIVLSPAPEGMGFTSVFAT